MHSRTYEQDFRGTNDDSDSELPGTENNIVDRQRPAFKCFVYVQSVLVSLCISRGSFAFLWCSRTVTGQSAFTRASTWSARAALREPLEALPRMGRACWVDGSAVDGES